MADRRVIATSKGRSKVENLGPTTMVLPSEAANGDVIVVDNSNHTGTMLVLVNDDAGTLDTLLTTETGTYTYVAATKTWSIA